MINKWSLSALLSLCNGFCSYLDFFICYLLHIRCVFLLVRRLSSEQANKQKLKQTQLLLLLLSYYYYYHNNHNHYPYFLSLALSLVIGHWAIKSARKQEKNWKQMHHYSLSAQVSDSFFINCTKFILDTLVCVSEGKI